MAKDKKKKGDRAKKEKAAPTGESPKAAARPKRAKVSKVAKVAKAKAAELASNPAVAEVVAATLVAAAAAMRNPDKARAMATAAADELESVAADAKGRGSTLWALALDVARRSLESAGTAVAFDLAAPKKAKAGKKKKGKT